MFRILLLGLLLNPVFADEGEIKKVFRIDLNEAKTIYIKPELILDITRINKSGSTLKDTQRTVISVIIEF